ncbi:MAG: DUF6493 family protein [Janthinobacterium lividum]
MLTPAQTFEDIILHKTIKELTPFLLSLDKKDAIALRKPIQALKKDLEEYRQVERKDGKSEYKCRITFEHRTMLALAGFATFSKKEALGRGFDMPYSFRNDSEYPAEYALFMQVLRQVRPDWLTDLLVRNMRSNPWGALSYWQLRELEKEGLISYDAPTFALAAAGLLNRYNWLRNAKNAKKMTGLDQKILADLRADATILQRDLPLAFDFETSINSDNTYEGEYQKGFTIDWLLLLPQLVESGHLDRADLLTRSLLALRRDFRRPLLTWFKEVFLALKPTVAERLGRQSELVELLAHPLPLVVNFALDQLKDLWTEPEFNPAPLLQYADGLMSRQDLKTGLKALLGQFDKLLKRQPAYALTLARLAAAALAHADGGVQERAAKLLAALLGAKKPVLAAEETAEITATIAAYADLLSSGTRPLLAPWLTAAPEQQPATGNQEPATYIPLAAFVPDISPATAIAPVADWHELLFLTGVVLQEQAPDPAAMERWLDGLLRLRGQFPSSHAGQLQPYVQQALGASLRDKTPEAIEIILRSYVGSGYQNGQHNLLLALLIGWRTDFEHPQLSRINLRPNQYYTPDPLLLLEQRRLAAAEEQLRPGAAHLPLLSTPTHAPQWVAPATLVQKLLAYHAAACPPDAADLAVALARCAWQAEPAATEARALLPQLPADELHALLTWLLAPAEPAAPATPTAEVTAAAPAPPLERTEPYGNQTSTLRTVELAPAPVPVPAPTPAHAAGLPLLAPPDAAAGLDKTLLQRAKERLSKLIPLKKETAAPVPIALAEALPWLWAVAARTRYPVAELPPLSQMGDFPGLARPWQPGWTLSEFSRTYVQQWQKNKPTVTDTWTHLYVPTVPAPAPSPLLLYSVHARLAETKNLVWNMRLNLAYQLALLPHNPEPLHWHVLREACRTDDQGSEARDVLQTVLRALLGPGPRHAAGTSALLAAGLVHHAPVCRALALEVLLNAIDTARLVPADLGRALGRLLAAERAPVQRLADALAQTRAISPATDDALRQLLAALLPELPAAPIRNTAKLLDAYANLRNGQPVPPAVRARLGDWQAVGSLKKLVGLLA